ncbi:MAG: dihydroorotase [Methanobrevibacter thaueri]|jgi:dihydroorotase|uniref:dihydroorotase n=1 Tax=Methanobrevibacter thaueri TaxID=190975 RepID=UPI0026F26206|nr:dihydroorotase family protein [Methanobrevibacter thaueri]MBE6496025.1 dihydroorotase [Methanobrevibacter thaueri]
MDLVLKNCKLVDRTGEHYIKIDDGKITDISKAPLKASKTIDMKNNYVLPGFIDPHIHFRDPGLTQKEDFKTGSMAAANGGFTTVIDMPNTLPKTNTYKALKEKIQIAERKSVVNFELQAGPNTLDEMERMMELNPIAFKVFMDLESDESLEKIFHDLSLLKQRTDYNGLVATHCEKKSIVERETGRLKEKAENEAIDYTYARPVESEDESVRQAIDLARANQLRLHICHLSSRKSLSMAKSASKSMPVSWEFTPHHLLMDNSSYNIYETFIKTNPPLRQKQDSVRISDLDEESIIGTDHAPHTLEDKTKGTWVSSPGIPNLETVVPLLLTEVNKGNIDLKIIPKIFSQNAAKVYELKNKGEIAVGKDADLTVIDLKQEGKFNIDEFKTKAEYSPFDGWEYQGLPVMTIVNGKIVMDKL